MNGGNFMENNKACPICGCKEIGRGVLHGQGCMHPINEGFFTTGSNVLAEICTSCGYILSMAVEEPEKFKK